MRIGAGMKTIDKLVNKIFCADCIEFLRELPPDSIDLCVADPGQRVFSKKKTLI